MKALSLLFTLLLSFSSYATTKVTASVSQNPVAVGQAFTLEVVADDTLPVNEFDPSVLLRQNFVVGSTATGRQHTSINGKSSTQTRWTTTLLVREEGSYLIPSFTIGGQATIPIKLKAKVIDKLDPSNDQVRMEVSIDQHQVYLGQPVRYTSKIWVANSLDQANIIAPNMLNAKIDKLGDDKQDLEIVDGKRYRTLIRQWLITPEKAGQFDIKGAHLSGLVNDGNYRTRPIDIEAQNLSLKVNPPPANFPGTWLPSSDLLLSEEVQPLQSDYQQGQAFTRIINLTVAGITEKQLPEIELDYGDNFRVYPEPYQDRTIVKDGIVFAQRTLHVALIPINSGQLTLPAWKLPWWDLSKDKLAYAEIEKREIKVSPAPMSSQLNSMPPASTTSAITTAQGDERASKTSLWTWFFALAWLSTLAALIFIWWRYQPQSHKHKVSKDRHTQAKEQPSDSWSSFSSYCQQNQTQLAEQMLNRWVSQQQLTKQFSDLQAELSAINWGKENQPDLDLKDYYQRCLAMKNTLENQAKQAHQSLASLNP
ncbi:MULTISPECIES: BatD family protein [unclassified Agarivorans]|uniref:BatD family protein n=1 Tax=unclassified Agarivorans TaxID=2636026 RepID=UPI003D7E9B1A